MLVFDAKEMKFSRIKFKHACFDKDGTLIDVHATWVPITYRRAQKIIQFFELPQVYFDQVCAVMGVDVHTERITPGGPVGYKPRKEIIQSAVEWLKKQKVEPGYNQLAEIFAEIDVEFQNKPDFIPRAHPGVVQGLKQLKKSGIKISIYTSDRHKNTEKALLSLGLLDEVDAIVGGDDVKNSKPDPEGFLKACDELGIDVKHSVYVGDTHDDIRMARLSGCAGCFGMAHGLSSRADLETDSDVVFETFPQLVEFFIKNGKKTTSTI